MFSEHSANEWCIMSFSAEINQLRSRIASLEGLAEDAAVGVASLGVGAIDSALPWGGLPLGNLHELLGCRHGDGIQDGAALGFSALLLARFAAATGRPVLWVATGDLPYPPGLAALGLDPERLVMVRAYRATQGLWAMEEGLRCRALAGVLAETWGMDLTAARRLQLAARTSGVPALLLNHGEPVGPAATRWRVGPLAGHSDPALADPALADPALADPALADPALGVGAWRWRVELLRCRGRAVGDDGTVATWDVEWNDETRGLRLATPAGDRAAAPQRLRAAG
jgi:protein ImuA